MPEAPPPGKSVFRALILDLETGEKVTTQTTANTPDDAVGQFMENINVLPVEDPAEWWSKYKILNVAVECKG